MSLIESVDGGATLGAVLVIAILLSLSVVFLLSPPGSLSPGDLDKFQLIGVGTALLLSTVITAVFALKTSRSDPF